VGSIDVGRPYRQKEVVAEINKALVGAKKVHGTHILYVRRAYNVETNGAFCYTQSHVSPKYSKAFLAWILKQFAADSQFFEKAKVISEQKKTRAA
jgi:hypothetical protein